MLILVFWASKVAETGQDSRTLEWPETWKSVLDRSDEGNTTIHFEGDFSSRFPLGILTLKSLKCTRFVFFSIDRLAAYPSVTSLMSHDQEKKTSELQELHRSIIGWLFLEESERLSQLDTYAPGYHHLLIETVGSKIEIVFENLEIMNSSLLSKTAQGSESGLWKTAGQMAVVGQDPGKSWSRSPYLGIPAVQVVEVQYPGWGLAGPQRPLGAAETV